MQSLEAVFSLVFFMSLAGAMLLEAEPRPIDESVYQMQLAGDSWRVLYLRGALRDFPDRGLLEGELDDMGGITGLCYFISGINYTNCRGGPERTEIAVLRRTVIDGGMPRAITFSVQK